MSSSNKSMKGKKGMSKKGMMQTKEKASFAFQPKEGWVTLLKNKHNKTIMTPPHVSSLLSVDRSKFQHLILQCKQQYACVDDVPAKIVSSICSATQRYCNKKYASLDLNKEIGMWKQKVFTLSFENEYETADDVEAPSYCWVLPGHSPKFFVTELEARKHVLKMAAKNKMNWLLSSNPFSGGFVYKVIVPSFVPDPLIESMAESWKKFANEYESVNGEGSYDAIYSFIPVYEETDDEETDESDDDCESDLSVSD